MIKKPEKKKLIRKDGFEDINRELEAFNQAIEEYEAFLPDEKEIMKIIVDNCGSIPLSAKAIYKRIRGEK